MRPERELLTKAYAAFNARDIEAAVMLMHPKVMWPDGMEGGYVYGHNGVWEYWTRQWNLIDPHVEPLDFSTDAKGHVVVDVQQVIRDLKGRVLTNQRVQHIYEIVDGLIMGMKIKTP